MPAYHVAGIATHIPLVRSKIKHSISNKDFLNVTNSKFKKIKHRTQKKKKKIDMAVVGHE